MKRKYIKILLMSFCVVLLSLFFYNFSYSKYIIEETHTIANINIDKSKPKIELISVTNTNKNYEQYANHTHTLTFKFKAIEDNLKINNINNNKDSIKFKINDNFIDVQALKLSLVYADSKERTYVLSITGVQGNGKLQIVFSSGLLIDNSDQTNDETIYDTGIIIDNISPTYILTETLLADKKSNILLSCNESIRPFDGWNFSNNNTNLSLTFPSPADYEVPITDYAQNSTNANVVVEKASYILINYCNYTWTKYTDFSTGGKISNKNLIINDEIFKTEAILVYLEGNCEKDFLDCQFYDYTYWGEGSKALCTFAECAYYYGYNPIDKGWYNFSLNCDGHIINFVGGQRCLQLGGFGQNLPGRNCIGYRNPIPSEIAEQYLFGVSGINFKLNTTEDFSVIYQAYVRGIGWVNTSADGIECTYRHDRPFTSFRMNLIPKSEKQRYMNYWDKDVGTNNVD